MSPLDFEALLSRNYRPARVTHLVPQEQSSSAVVRRPRSGSIHDEEQEETQQQQQRQRSTTAAASEEQKKKENQDAMDEQVLKLAMQLVSQTPAYKRHVKSNGETQMPSLVLSENDDTNHNSGRIPKAPVDEWKTLPPSLHEVELGDWEKAIQWEGVKTQEDTTRKKDEPTPSTVVVSSSDASSLLQQKRNPHLEALVLDSSNISWDGSRADLLAKARNIPLVLDVGTAGRSVAKHLLPPSRPVPYSETSAYLQRYEREWSTPATSTANVSTTTTTTTSGSLHADRDQLDAIIAERQKKRAQMAKDKSTRVTEAMGTLALGAGKGRTITSSLMGPGGTERTGRPSRQVGSSSTHDVEYVEQLDMVYNHALVKPDLRKVELRQYHRPKLPLSVVRVAMPWQFQIRVTPNNNHANNSNARNNKREGGSSYQSIMMGTHAGAMSQSKIRNEADLSPTEGQLVLLEYCEERPPIQLNKGMASKIVNYYRGDKSKCPVSAGGGDRPIRRKQHADSSSAANKDNNKNNNNKSKDGNKVEPPPKLVGPDQTFSMTVTDWIGKAPKKTSRDADRAEKSSVHVLPEGVTEILHPKVHGPFIGEVEEGTTQTGLISNLFAAPMFCHEPESTDFLMILGRKPIGVPRPGSIGPPQSIGVVLRPMPSSVFTVGQTEPRTKVFAPNTTAERSFTTPFVCHQVAKAITRTEEKEDCGLRFDEIKDGLFANTEMMANALRQRIKQVAIYDKNTQIWTSKPIGFEDYPGVEALGRKFSPEGVAAYETENATIRRLSDLGLHYLLSSTGAVATVGLAMVYLTGQVNAARERKSKMNKTLEIARTTKGQKPTQIALYEKSASKLDAEWKEIRRRHEVARFIHEELQLAPWHIASEFIDVHKHAQGTAMMKLTGLGDPSGLGEGYNFLRALDTKPNKSSGNTDGALNAQIKKITGTENDLRKLTMKQMERVLRSYGMGQKEIDTLKRWDRVHVIRDLSTKAASDGMGDGLERFARGEKMKLSDQKQMYQARIQEIWRRQRAALSTDAGDIRPATPGPSATPVPDGDAVMSTSVEPASSKQEEKDKDESDSDSDDDDLAAMLEEDMMDVQQTNQLVAEHVRGADGNSGDLMSVVARQQQREDTQDLSKDARELAALKRQREEERAAQAGLLSGKTAPGAVSSESKPSLVGRKVVRRRVTKTHPDGRQTTSFKFIVTPAEVDKIIARKKKEEAEGKDREEKSKKRTSKHHGSMGHGRQIRPVGHAVFEDEDEDHHSSRRSLKFQVNKTTRVVTTKPKKARMHMARAPPKMKKPKVQLGKLKQKISQEKRIKKRKREAEEADLYVTASKRKGTSNRRERGAARDRMPHVILADRMEGIRSQVEKRTGSGPFHRPVNRRALPRYYEVISNPIDLQTIRDKNQRYEYKTAEAFLRDFDLMRSNAIKFNGAKSILGDEATLIYEYVKNQIAENRAEFDSMEEAVREQLAGKKKKKKSKASSNKSPGSAAAGTSGNSGTFMVDGVAVNLGDLEGFDGADSDSDDSFTGLGILNL